MTDAVAEFARDFERVERALARVIVGQDPLIGELLTAVLARGHVLLEGLPGLGKTHLAKALANAIGQPLARIQCTPDLLPADITGSEVLVKNGAEGPRLEFRRGPLFAPLVLVDEINRATSRTQSALLEAMQEGQVTCGGARHRLPSPFWVLATQNPIELEGTYPLPEAQLDRFFFKCVVPYPSGEALLEIVDVSLDDEPSEALEQVLPPGRVETMMRQARDVVVADAVKRRAADLVLATQPRSGALAAGHLRYGASPRALQTLLRAARVTALAAGRGHVSLDDLRATALPALRHRVLLSIESEVAGVQVDQLLAQIVEAWARAH